MWEFSWKEEDAQPQLVKSWTKKQQAACDTVVVWGQGYLSLYIVQYCIQKLYKSDSFTWKIKKVQNLM